MRICVAFECTPERGKRRSRKGLRGPTDRVEGISFPVRCAPSVPSALGYLNLASPPCTSFAVSNTRLVGQRQLPRFLLPHIVVQIHLFYTDATLVVKCSKWPPNRPVSECRNRTGQRVSCVPFASQLLWFVFLKWNSYVCALKITESLISGRYVVHSQAPFVLALPFRWDTPPLPLRLPP